MIPIASKDQPLNYASRRIDAKLDRETAILFKRLRLGMEYAGAFENENSEPTTAMALRELIRRAAAEAVVVDPSGKPESDESRKSVAATKPAELKPRIPKGNK